MANEEYLMLLDKFCYTQVDVARNPETSPMRSAATLIFNGLSHNAPRLLGIVADSLGIEHKSSYSSVGQLRKIVSEAEKQGFHNTTGMKRLLDLHSAINKGYKQAEEKPWDVVRSTLMQIRIAKDLTI